MKKVNVTTGYGIITKSNGEIVHNTCDVGTMVINTNDTYTPLSKKEFEDLKVFNYSRFMVSLLNDATISGLIKDPYYGAVSDSLRGKNWATLRIIIDKMVEDEDSVLTEELNSYFKNKIEQEEGVIL